MLSYYLKYWPHHSHVNTVYVRPPFEVLVGIGHFHRAIKISIDVRIPATNKDTIGQMLSKQVRMRQDGARFKMKPRSLQEVCQQDGCSTLALLAKCEVLR